MKWKQERLSLHIVVDGDGRVWQRKFWIIKVASLLANHYLPPLPLSQSSFRCQNLKQPFLSSTIAPQQPSSTPSPPQQWIHQHQWLWRKIFFSASHNVSSCRGLSTKVFFINKYNSIVQYSFVCALLFESFYVEIQDENRWNISKNNAEIVIVMAGKYQVHIHSVTFNPSVFPDFVILIRISQSLILALL